MNKPLTWTMLGLAALLSTSAMAANYDDGYGSGPGYGGFYFGVSAGEVFYNEEGIPS